MLIFIFYFINFSVTNIFNGVGTDTHGLSSSEASFYLISGSLMACIFGLSSGRVVEKIGRTPSIFLAGSLQCIGFLVSSLLIEAGMVPFTLGICLFYAG